MPALTDDYREQLRLLGQRSGDQPNTLAGVAPTPADAWDYNSQAAQDWLAYQRSLSDQRGLWNSQTGWPTQAGMADAGKQMANALVLGTTAPGFRAFHGSPHDFDRFDTANIGTGEGAQVYGHGLYFADREGIAKKYRDDLAEKTYLTVDDKSEGYSNVHKALHGAQTAEGVHPNIAPQVARNVMDMIDEAGSIEKALKTYDIPSDARYGPAYKAAIESAQRMGLKRNPGHMYEVNINANPEHFLDWDKPLSEQSKHVQEALKRSPYPPPDRNMSVADYISHLETNREYATKEGDPSAHASAALREAGIPGIRYLDAGSRGTGEGTSNHVVFDAKTIEILRKYGLAGLMAGGAAAGATKAEQ